MRLDYTNLPSIQLLWEQIAAQRLVSGQELSGLHKPQAYARLGETMDAVALGLVGYVLKDQAGETVTRKLHLERRSRPRWLPKFLWERMPIERFDAELSVTPNVIYPRSTIIADLGQPVVKFAITEDPGEWQR